ncbi:MAG TPA: response regulator [Polyangiaceae bacterium]|nr:response regulator [Polyangiaceae bacterium]
MPAAIDILIVDDEPRNLDALEAILANPGYRLIRATSGDEALRLLLKHEVAAIVLDIRMPGLNGVELAQLIKSNKRFSEVPIVLLTAYLLDDQDVIAGYGVGAVDYLTKPVNPAVLRHKIAGFAELFRKTRALAELNATLEERVSERTRELEASEAALRASGRQKDEFLAVLAHELRNPLAPLRMGLDLLRRADPPLAAYASTLTVMNRQLEHMVRLIDDLLDLARVNNGTLELKRAPIDLGTYAERALEASRPFFDKRGQSISVRTTPGISVLADPTRIVQIVGNLLHNGSKFTPEGGSIALEVARDGERAVVRVIDSGIGIAPQRLTQVFEMFVRFDGGERGVSTGLGIGLALARRLAQMHDGSLTVESAGLGQGSTFELSLPAQPTRQAAAPASVRPQPLVPRQPGESIVVIEDNVDSAEMLRLWLETKGYRVDVARTGPDGLELVQRRRPRIVICDIGLPEMDGIEVCRLIRQSAFEVTPLMIALTGWGMEADRRRTRETGFDHHLVKPVEPETLFQLLEGVGS